MKKLGDFLSIVGLCILLTGVGNSATINVPGGQPTIQAGIDAAVDGDIVLVAPGIYTENLYIDLKSIVLTSSGGAEVTVLQPSNPLIPTIIVRGYEYPQDVEFSGFTVTGGGAVNTCEVYEASLTITENIFHNNIPIGTNNATVITCRYANSFIIRNLFYDNGGIGCVGLGSSAGGSQIINNTFDNNEKGFYTTTSGIAINNIVTNSLNIGVGGSEKFSVLDYNNVWNNNPNYNVDSAKGSNSISLDPLFSSPLFKIYNLQFISPCIDAGDPDISYNDPDGTRNDIGVYQFEFGYENPPLPTNILISPSTDNFYLLDSTPIFDWSYYTVDPDTQNSYEIEVGTDNDWNVAELWATGEVFSSDTSVTYSGDPLVGTLLFYARIRVSNGSYYGSWVYFHFTTKTGNVINVEEGINTIQGAIIVAEELDSIIVGPGTYIENLDFLGKTITLTSSSGPENTTIQALSTVIPIVMMNSGEGTATVLSGFTITGGGDVTTTIDINGTSPTIENNIFHGNITIGTNSIEVISCQASSALITKNLFYNNGGIGCVGLRLGGLGVKIINNTFDANERGFFSIAGGGYAINNIVTNSIDIGIVSVTANDFTVLDYNNVWNNNINYDMGGSSGANSISSNPNYFDPANNEFFLRFPSTCYNAGDPNPLYDDPDGTRNDMGAFSIDIGSYPIAYDIEFSPSYFNYYVTNPTPTFSWTFTDSGATNQAQYEIEVGIDNDWTVAEMWTSGIISSGAHAALYSGSSLQDNTIYYIRIRISNGAKFGIWNSSEFYANINQVNLVPSDYLSIQEAIDSAKVNDTIIVSPGLYYENLVFNGENLVLLSEQGSEVTTIQPSNPSLPVVSIVFGEDDNTIFSGFTITSTTISEAIRISNSSPIVEENKFHSNDNVAIFCENSSSIIRSNIFYDNIESACIVLNGDNSGILIVNNTFNRNISAIRTNGVSGGIVYNNIITNSINFAIIGSFSDANYNLFHNNYPDNSRSSSGGANDILADPLFLDSDNNDYHIKPTSPCRNSGHPSGAYNDPDGSRNDIGALYLGSLNFPVANFIRILPDVIDSVTIGPNPLVTWSYLDVVVSSQSKFEVQVGTDDDWTTAELWSSGEITSSSNEVEYTGVTLINGNEYYVRMRVSDGSSFGEWRSTTVKARLTNVIVVPTHETTIQAAIDVAVNGDTVEVLPGAYVENLNFLGKSIVVVSSNGPTSTTIVPSDKYSSTVVFTSGEDSTTKLSGFTIRNSFNNTINIDGSSPVIENNIFFNNVVWLYQYEVITCTNSSALITRNLFYNNGSLGCVGLREGAAGARIINNTFDSNQNGFFSIANGGTAINNIVTNSVITGVGSLNENGFAVLDYNNIWNNSTDYNYPVGAGVNSISTDPSYVDVSSQNYQLTPLSLCVDAGDPNPIYNDPDGSRNDMGMGPFAECCNLRGDINHNGSVAIEDLTELVNFFFKGGSAAICDKEADLNGSDAIDIADLTYLVNYMFKSGPLPVSCN